MSHLTEERILEIRDGEPSDPTDLRHLEGCAVCRAGLDEAEQRGVRVASVLRNEVVQVDVEAAKQRARARLDGERESVARSRLGARALPWAAALAAISLGSVAYALPGSPVPGWLGLEQPALSMEASDPQTEVAETVPGEVVVVSAAGGIDVTLEDVPPATVVSLEWLDGSDARVSGGHGAEYSIGEGRVTARAPNGPVRLGIPRSSPDVTVRINGRVVYRGGGDAGEASLVVTRSDDRIVFMAPNP